MEAILEGKNILITGASSGIGRDAAITLSGAGARVLLVARNEERLEEVRHEIIENGGNCTIFPFDLRQIDNIADIFKKIIGSTSGGFVDGFLHCAAVAPLRPLKNNSYKVMHDTFLTNFYSFIEISRHFAEQKFSNGWGSIVGISSIASVSGESGRVAYSATKGAMDSSVRVMAKELAVKRIRVNSIRPGMTDTPLTREYIEFAGIENINDYLKRFQPLGLIEPNAVSQMALYLLSDMSKFVTGTSFNIDSGRLS